MERYLCFSSVCALLLIFPSSLGRWATVIPGELGNNMFSIPPEIAWVIPVIIPFIIGLLIGLIIKRTLKLLLLITVLIIILVALSYISLSFRDVYESAMKFLPKIIDLGSGFMNSLPYTSVAFIVGLLLGLWKG